MKPYKQFKSEDIDKPEQVSKRCAEAISDKTTEKVNKRLREAKLDY